MWRYATLPVSNQICRKLLFNNLSIDWSIKILLKNFVRTVHRCSVPSFVQIGQISWEEFEKVGLRLFSNLWKKTLAEMGVAYTTRFSTNHLIRGSKVFKCATQYMGIMSQNALSLIIAPSSGGNFGRQ